MDNFINSMAVNPYFIVIISIFGAFGTIFGIYSYILNKQNKKIGYSLKSFTLVNETLSNVKFLEINYKDKLIKNLSVVEMLITNNGNVLLKNTDIYEKYPLELCLSNVEGIIIDIEIDETSSDTCEFTIKKINEKKWQLYFEYLEKKDFIKLRIYHTGAENTQLCLTGKIIDGTIEEFESIEYQKILLRSFQMMLPLGLLENLIIALFSAIFFEKNKKT